MGRTSILRNNVLAFVQQHKAGLKFAVIERQFRAVDSEVLRSTLYNLRQDGHIHNIKATGERGNATWLPGPDPRGVTAISTLEAKRAQRAREADQREPLVYFGQGLQPPRCPSVWAYARHFRESRA